MARHVFRQENEERSEKKPSCLRLRRSGNDEARGRVSPWVEVPFAAVQTLSRWVAASLALRQPPAPSCRSHCDTRADGAAVSSVLLLFLKKW